MVVAGAGRSLGRRHAGGCSVRPADVRLAADPGLDATVALVERRLGALERVTPMGQSRWHAAADRAGVARRLRPPRWSGLVDRLATHPSGLAAAAGARALRRLVGRAARRRAGAGRVVVATRTRHAARDRR